MYHTYILISQKTGKLYIGHTNNLQRRLIEHNSNKSKSTRNRGPWNILFAKEFSSKSEATQFELKLKNFKSREFIINNLPNL